jgi:uncharacterized protein with NAD-binding domain and iron-sulfur cluster
MSPPRVAVIGGGLAGITAAIALAEAGAAVTLLEARPRLGGATCSFSRDGLTVDTGQHVFLGCCTAYRGLLAQLGMTAHAPLQHRFDVTVLAPGPNQQDPQGPRRERLRRTALPGPLHMLPALARYRFLSFTERAVVSRPALAMRRVDPADPVVDEQRFGDWLSAHGQDDRARRALWDLFTVSALNIAGDDASLALAATVVKTGLLGRNNAADIGVPALPLGELHGDAAATLLAKLGAQVLTNAKVSAIEPAPAGAPLADAAPADPALGHAAGRPPADDTPGPNADRSPADDTPGPNADRPPADDTPGPSADRPVGPGDPSSPRFLVRLARPTDCADVFADAVVLAVPHEAAARLIPPGALPDSTVAGWAGLGASPIVNVHVIYDRPVTDLPFAAAVDSPVQWVFDRTRISGLDRQPQPEANETRDSLPSSEVNPGVHSAAGAEGAARRPQYLAISLSAADEYVDVPAAALRERFLPALAELFPVARDAQVTEFFVTRERRATFRQAPGSGKLRPPAATRLPGLVLAGAWTATGWPDTMEGAVRSGLAAASELRRTVPSLSGPSQSGPSLSGPSLSGPSAPGLSRAGYSGSVVSGSGVNASASTIGVRQ